MMEHVGSSVQDWDLKVATSKDSHHVAFSLVLRSPVSRCRGYSACDLFYCHFSSQR